MYIRKEYRKKKKKKKEMMKKVEGKMKTLILSDGLRPWMNFTESVTLNSNPFLEFFSLARLSSELFSPSKE